MSFSKAEFMEYEYGGIRKSDKMVCSNHFADYAVISFIEQNGSKVPCSYCKTKYQSHYVVSMDDLLNYLNSGIQFFYDDAANAGLPYESAEGGYQGEHFDTYDLLDEIGLDTDLEVKNDIVRGLPDFAWCKKDPFTLEYDIELMYHWKRFSDLVKHKVRYSFFRTREFDLEEKEASDILREIALGTDELDLIKPLKMGDVVFRSRQHEESEYPESVGSLGSPPLKFCKISNRMSPAGISMFYGALIKIHVKLRPLIARII